MCSVVGCDSFRRSAHRFKLPEDPERRLEWVQFIFEVNQQRFKESSWTDITVCREHFTEDCFVKPTRTGSVQLKPGAVPSLGPQPEPEGAEPHQESVGTTGPPPRCDQLRPCESQTPCPDNPCTLTAAPGSPVPSDASASSGPHYGRMLQKIANIDLIREKAALLQTKGKYVVSEKQLLQLFTFKCPLCGSKVKVEKVVHGVLVVLNQQCLRCDYRSQWKSQVNARVPAAEDKHPAGGTKVISETVPTDDSHGGVAGGSEIVAVIDEESSSMDETEESGDEGDMDSDEDWNPAGKLLLATELRDESDEESAFGSDDCTPLAPEHSQLCTDCGVFFRKRKQHTCEHKMKPYSCNICGKRCVTEIALKAHSRIHNENYEHRCKYCHAAFKTKVDKSTHEQTHLAQGKPYKCPDCSETFASNKKRRVHLEDHRGPRQLKCHVCGIEFLWPLSLQRHMAVHTGEKAFKCSVCERGFNQASHLKSHMRLHTGERPYKCQYCDTRFNHNVSLKSHILRHHASSSGAEKMNQRESDTGDAQGHGGSRGMDSGLDYVEEEQDTEEEVQKKGAHGSKKKRRSTGRPIGRPKSFGPGTLVLAAEVEGEGSDTKTEKSHEEDLRRTRCSDEESEDEPSFDSAEEDEEKAMKTTIRSRGRPKESDSDSDFRPSRRKEKEAQRHELSEAHSAAEVSAAKDGLCEKRRDA